MWLVFAILAVDTPPPLPADIDAALRVADELETQDAFDAARRQLEAVLPLAPKMFRDDIRLQRCATWALQEDEARAHACYVSDDFETLRGQALARYRAWTPQLDGPARARAAHELETLVLRAPGTHGAERALRRLRARAREARGDAGEISFLLDLAERAPKGRLRAEMLVTAGRLRLERGSTKSAVQILQRAVTAAAQTVWLDDALYYRSRALAAAGRYEEAVASYEALVDTRESSWFMGSYDGLFFDDALFELGQTYEKWGRLDEALEAYNDLPDRAPTSRLCDDAAFAAARIKLGRGDPEPLEAFIEAFPESPLRDDAERMMRP